MATEYEGKSPNKLWYFWQGTKAYFKSFGDYTTKKESQGSVKNIGIGLGALAVGQYVAVPLVAAVPLAPIVVSIASVWTACHFAIKSYRDFKSVKDSSFSYNYVREQEYKWIDKKSRGSFLKRSMDSVKGLFKSKKKAPKEDQKKKPASEAAATINTGVAFDKSSKSFDFNDGAAPPETGAPANDMPAAPKVDAPRIKGMQP